MHNDTNIVDQTHQTIKDIFDGKVKLDRNGLPTAVVAKPTSFVSDGESLVTDEVVRATGEDEPGTLKNIVDSRGTKVIYRKQVNGRWAPQGSLADTYQDLTPSEKGDILRSMNKSADTNLIPNAAEYLDNGFNVLLIGLHGTGKTASIMALARDRGFKMKYYSCSTLDPFTDLVGVPMARDYCPECSRWFTGEPGTHTECDDCGGRTVESLKMVRPRDVDEAEIIFLDEFNRADSKTQNALFEMIQFGTINGEPLPNLKACWAAINPPDDEQNYAVDPIDPALMDRFDVYIPIEAKPSVVYMTKHMPEPIARALKLWWDDHQNAVRAGSKDAHADYISPRRLEKIGLVWCATKNARSVYASLPITGSFEKSKLLDQLKAAQEEVDREAGIDSEADFDGLKDLGGNNIGDRAAGQFIYKKASMRLKKDELVEYLSENPLNYETHNRVVEELRTGTGGEDMVQNFGEIINALNPSSLEGLIAGQPDAKVKLMRKAFINLHKDDPTLAKSLIHLHKVLSLGNTDPNWPDTL